MYITFNTIITFGSVLAAVSAVITVVLKVHKFYLNQQRQDVQIEKLQNENALICFGLSACLDGLQQLGANHTVSRAKEKLDKYLNTMAHK